jgi:hypothetical protein
MQHFRVFRVVYWKTPVQRCPGEWVGTPCNLLSEVLSEPGTWTEAYEDFRLAVWAIKRSNTRLPKDMYVEIILHAYCTRHGHRTNPFTIDSMLNDKILKEREWSLHSHRE